MESLSRISETFVNVISTLKTEKSSERVSIIKKYLNSLSTELMVLGKENHDQFVRSIAMEGYLKLLSTKTLPMSLQEKRDILKIAFEKIKPYALRDECLYITMRIQNLLCYYLIQLEQIDTAKNILEDIEDLYDRICENDADRYCDVEGLFSAMPLQAVRKLDPENIDRIITNNIQMQAFIYNKLNQPYMYTLYHHTALRRQLELKEGSPQIWAIRCARFGDYFTSSNRLGNARHNLCAAYHVLKTCHENCKLYPEEFILQKDDFEKYFLELSHHWVKYGMTLFELSKKKILKLYFSRVTASKSDLWKAIDKQENKESVHEFDKSDKVDEVTSAEQIGEGDFISEKLFTFPSLELSELEARVPSKCVSNAEEARRLFTFTHKWLIRARSHYSIEKDSAQYITYSLRLAELYEHLAFFERNIDRQYNVQKRRADVLEHLNTILKNRGNVVPVQIDVLRELSQVQLDMMALNLRKLWRTDSKNELATDSDAIIRSVAADISPKTIMDISEECATTRNITRRKIEAASSINARLFRLCSQLAIRTPSRQSLSTS